MKMFKGATFIKSLKKYLSENDELSISNLQRQTGLGFVRAGIAIDWLKEVGVLVENYPLGLVVDKSKISILDDYLTAS